MHLARGLVYTLVVGRPDRDMIGIDPDPDKIQLGMSIDVVYQIAPRKDGEGNEYMTYCLKPAAA